MRPTSLRWEPSLAGAGNYVKARGDAARFSVSKKSFRPAERVFRTLKSFENLGFQWRRETGEAPPVADKASLFRGRLPISGYEVSTDWLEPTVYPFLGFPRTPFTRKGYAASAARQSRWRLPYLTVAENLPFYRQS